MPPRHHPRAPHGHERRGLSNCAGAKTGQEVVPAPLEILGPPSLGSSRAANSKLDSSGQAMFTALAGGGAMAVPGDSGRPLGRARRQWATSAVKSAVGFAAVSALQLAGAPPRPLPVARAASDRAAPGKCEGACVKQCAKTAPGEANRAYCEQNCVGYCESAREEGRAGGGDVVRQDLSETPQPPIWKTRGFI
eukprot:CAMPEP_0172617544 /NCGR_PEP_ID=MMETSP1068-20121228/70317_1 /TAXON_ID=35684 /ORGANISM="Pseudopedinella elastica, Strain CCMP716" /LENGTH=192 /DNA_ID=CAMNT_0013423319 /DNA_START=132 /DNA_END=710 /DNA_ORIENTATION=+